MRIIIDTNVFISGIFFGNAPRQIVEAVMDERVSAYASDEIIDEYKRVVVEMIRRKQGHLDESVYMPVIDKMEIIKIESKDAVCRDPDDDKFLNCAKDANALYIVSGDDDLLVLKKHGITQIITAKDFCDNVLSRIK